MREKYITAINAKLAEGSITLQNRIHRMGKGMPIEEWDEAQLKRLCTVCHINFLLSKEEEKAINQREADVMARRGIRHTTYHGPYPKLEGEDIAMMASYAKGSNKGAHDSDYWEAVDALEDISG